MNILEVSKKEKIRRRNIRLSKMLQPKNAVMILNELIKNTNYAVEELPLKTDGNQFKASVSVESQEHIGYGKYFFCEIFDKLFLEIQPHGVNKAVYYKELLGVTPVVDKVG